MARDMEEDERGKKMMEGWELLVVFVSLWG